MMFRRPILYFALLFTCSWHAYAQPPVVTYVTKIALVVQSDIYVDTLVNDSLMHLVSGRLRIALAPRNLETVTDQYLIAGDAIGRDKMEGLLFRAYDPHRPQNPWRSMPVAIYQGDRFPYGTLLIDTVLRPGERMALEFRLRGSDAIIQRCVFAREDLVPRIQQFRTNDPGSRTDDSIRSKALQRATKALKGFAFLRSDHLTAEAGKQIELLLEHHGLNKDSSIRYRIFSPRNPYGSWMPSGHLLTLRNLRGNDSFILQLKYEGMDRTSTYHVRVLPFWYQRPEAWVLFAVSGLLIFVALPVALHRQRRRTKRERREHNVRQLRNTQTQLNPHFIFNALNSIDGLVHDGENDKATRYLADFSDMMRNTLRNNDNLFTTLAEEMAVIEKYTGIEQLRFEFGYTIEVDPSIDMDAVEFPPMLLQPSVENAVKHGVAGMREAGRISIAIGREGNDLLITIEDNGRRASEKTGKGTGRGIRFTKERIAMLHKLYRHEIDYSLRYLPNRTIVHFHFKNWL